MTEDNKNKTRSKLTLKLGGSNKSQGAAANKSSASQKIGKSGIEVTIKGRKKEAKLEDKKESLNKDQMEAKMRLLSEARSNKNDQEIDVLDRISKEKEKKEKERETEKIKETKEEKSETTEINKEDKSTKEPETTVKENPGYEIDSFDIRNKIKQSLEVTKKEQEEREKIVEERKKHEQAKLEKERLENERRKSKKPPTKFSEEENKDKRKKGRPTFKEDRINTKKLTYIIGGNSDSDNDFSSGRGRGRRRKTKITQESQDNKEYKKIVREVAIPELITVADLSDRMAEKTGDVVKKLFSMGVVVTSNQAIDADTSEIIVEEFGHKVKRVSHSDVENVLEEIHEDLEQKSRAPIVTIMGHVDHGKTSLLDSLRETDIAGGEHGGITQHIGASRIKTSSGQYITFLDTPGHEAFTEMRSRGATATDLVVLVVAADDGIKAQTVEALNHAKAANVPMIVAINKIDKPGADPSRVKNELLSHDVVSEDLGGDVMFVEVSAKQKTNLDKLEEAILLQSEILDLKASYEGKSSGIVLESRVDPAKGVVATLLVQSGCLDVSDLIVVGTSYGKVRKMSDNNGKQVKIATPSVPVEILGLDNAPSAGDKFVEVGEERQAREIIAYRTRKEKEEKALKNSAKSITDLFNESGKGKLKYLNIVIKADVHGSVEAINGSIAKLNTDEVAIKVVHMATGGISESDINLAAVSNAIIIGFNVRANAPARELARSKGTDIRYYSIIYNLVDDLKLLLSGMLEPTKNEEYLGQAEIRQVFKVSGFGKIAGSFVTDGILKRNAKVRLLRDNVVIHDGTLKTLKRFKDDVKEVKNGFECGISFENYEDIKEGDSVECYEIVEQKRTL